MTLPHNKLAVPALDAPRQQGERERERVSDRQTDRESYLENQTTQTLGFKLGGLSFTLNKYNLIQSPPPSTLVSFCLYQVNIIVVV